MPTLTQPREPRRIVILTAGHTNPLTAKTASCLLRYRPDQIVALLDPAHAGHTTQELLGVGGFTPIVASLEDAPDASALLIGIAPPGGRIPSDWRAIILAASARGMDVISGLHDFLADDAEFAAAAAASGAALIDVRRNDERDVANCAGFREDCLRIHTVGQDCSVGKMLVAVELTNALTAVGRDAKFIATGQTGIMVEGDGVPIDCVVADFVAGAIEKQILAHQHRDVLVIEGQGSLAHPRYSAVTLGLLHGAAPHGLILCYEAARPHAYGMPNVPLTPLAKLRNVYETMANLRAPARVIGVAVNSRLLTAEESQTERDRVRAELGLPVCDVIRDGPKELVDAVIHQMKATGSAGGLR
jgi:uncharacterized NAD-dependent epimerase/dehydratase family protein